MNDQQVNIEMTVTENYMEASEEFVQALWRLTNDGDHQGYYNLLEASAREVEDVINHITADTALSPWIEGELEDGRTIFVARSGNAMAQLTPETQPSNATREAINWDEEIKACGIESFNLKFHTENIDYNSTWAVIWKEIPGSGVSVTEAVLATIITQGIRAMFKSLFLQGAAAAGGAAAGAVPVAINAGEQAMAEAAPPNVLVRFAQRFPRLARVGGLVASFLVFMVVLEVITLIVKHFIFQSYRVVLLVYNATDQDLEFSIPHLDNVPEKVKTLTVAENGKYSLPKMVNKGEPLGIGGKTKKNIIHYATIDMTSKNEFFEGMGWVVRLDDPHAGDPKARTFRNVVGTQSIPRFGNTSISLAFNDDRAGETFYNEEKGKHTEGLVSSESGRFDSYLSSKETAVEGGYNYQCGLFIIDKNKSFT